MGNRSFIDLMDGVIRYRQVHYRVTMDWLITYLVHWARAQSATSAHLNTMVTPTDDALDSLWAPLKGAALGISDAGGYSGLASYDRFIGCYNLPTGADEQYFFWTGAAGGAKQVIRTMLQLVHAFSGFAVNPYSRIRKTDPDTLEGSAAWAFIDEFDPCEGLDTFIDTLLTYNTGTDSSRAGTGGFPCRFTVNFRSEDSRHDGSRVENCDDRAAGERCGAGFKTNEGDLGLPWDEVELKWHDTLRFFYPSPYNTTFWGRLPKDGGRSANAYVSSRQSYHAVMFRAQDFAYYRLVVDWQMFLARLVADHASRTGGVTTAALQMARNALRIVLHPARLLIHEIGHTLLNNMNPSWDHANARCCNEIAALNWQCKVIGRLGLPLGGFSADDAAYPHLNPFDRTVGRPSKIRFLFDATETDHPYGRGRTQVRGDDCGGDDDGSRGYLTWTCDGDEIGSAHQDARFCLRQGWAERGGTMTISWELEPCP